MTLDEAIKHCEEVAEQKDIESLTDRWNDGDEWSESIKEDCKQCAADHRQLAEWLMELKEAKRLLKSATGIIKDVDCNEDYLCDECEYRAKCDGGFSFNWRCEAEALALIGEDGEQNG